MTISELRTVLADYPPDTRVILSSDAEGNSYGDAGDAAPVWYSPEERAVLGSEEDTEDAEMVCAIWPT